MYLSGLDKECFGKTLSLLLQVHDIKFQASTLEEKESWIKALNEGINRGKNKVFDEVRETGFGVLYFCVSSHALAPTPALPVLPACQPCSEEGIHGWRCYSRQTGLHSLRLGAFSCFSYQPKVEHVKCSLHQPSLAVLPSLLAGVRCREAGAAGVPEGWSVLLETNIKRPVGHKSSPNSVGDGLLASAGLGSANAGVSPSPDGSDWCREAATVLSFVKLRLQPGETHLPSPPSSLEMKVFG